MLPVISTDGSTFIDDNSLFFTGCFLISLRNGLKVLLFGLWTSYTYTSVSDSFFGNIDL
jgi:hypothetical protein